MLSMDENPLLLVSGTLGEEGGVGGGIGIGVKEVKSSARMANLAHFDRLVSLGFMSRYIPGAASILLIP